jgi:hypothetical protein
MSNIFDAAKNGDLEKVQSLLKANPDLVLCKDNDGRTALRKLAECAVSCVSHRKIAGLRGSMFAIRLEP